MEKRYGGSEQAYIKIKMNHRREEVEKIVWQIISCSCCKTTIKDYDEFEALIEEFVDRIIKIK